MRLDCGFADILALYLLSPHAEGFCKKNRAGPEDCANFSGNRAAGRCDKEENT
jgi:hypothetical protein